MKKRKKEKNDSSVSNERKNVLVQHEDIYFENQITMEDLQHIYQKEAPSVKKTINPDIVK